MVRTHFRVFEYDNGKSVFVGKSTCMVKAIEMAKNKEMRKVVKYGPDLPSMGESIWCTSRGFIGDDALDDGEHACAMDMIDEDNE